MKEEILELARRMGSFKVVDDFRLLALGGLDEESDSILVQTSDNYPPYNAISYLSYDLADAINCLYIEGVSASFIGVTNPTRFTIHNSIDEEPFFAISEIRPFLAKVESFDTMIGDIHANTFLLAYLANLTGVVESEKAHFMQRYTPKRERSSL